MYPFVTGCMLLPTGSNITLDERVNHKFKYFYFLVLIPPVLAVFFIASHTRLNSITHTHGLLSKLQSGLLIESHK